MGQNVVVLRGVCLLIGYAFGCLLTAELVTRLTTGVSPRQLGTGNPGMANVMDHVGVGAGLAVLAGDGLKTLLAVLLCRLVVGPYIGDAAMLYAGFGAMLGHNFPFWAKFSGGKGVAVTCVWLMLYLPGWGIICCLVGAGAVWLTGYLPLGAVLIPLAAVPFAFWRQGPEGGIGMVAVLLLMLGRHREGLKRMARRQERRFFRRSQEGDEENHKKQD